MDTSSPRRGDAPADIDATLHNLRDVAETDASAADALDFYQQMLIKQPDLIS